MKKTVFLILGFIFFMSNANAAELSEKDQLLATKALNLLQARLGNDAVITATSVETITWPNGAMGCPKGGMNYTQALTKGYRVVLETNGRQYFYHGRKGGEPFYCAKPSGGNSWIMDR